jgi:hypothetical protein
MRELIRHILKESSSKLRLLKVIEDEGVFNAAELVGGIDNLKKILKDEPKTKKLFDSLKGNMNLIYHSNKEFIEFPVRFEIVGIKKNTWKSNSWPQVNLIYDDSNFYEDEKELFDQFVYHTIGDLNIGNVDIKPEARDMYKDGHYVAIDFVNGKDLESLDHDVEYFDKDIKNLYRKYMENNKLNESRRLTENEEDPTQKVLNALLRRTKVEEINLGDDEEPIIHKTLRIDMGKGYVYGVHTFMNKKEQIKHLITILMNHNIIDEFEFNETRDNPYAQKVIRAVRQFITQVM